MNISSVPIEFAIDEIRKELHIPYNEQTLADDIKNGSLQICFYYNSCLAELENTQGSMRLEETLIKLHTIHLFRGDLIIDTKFSNCFEIINDNIEGEIYTVVHNNKTYLLMLRELIAQKEIFSISPGYEHIYNWKEAIEPQKLTRNQLRVTRASLDKFLSTNNRNKVNTDEGEIAEMNSDKALAIMAIMLSKKSASYKIGNRPNSAKIADEIYETATKHFSENQLKGLNSFHKRISKALKTLDPH